MEYFREYRDVFYANTGPDHPPKTNSQSPVSLLRTRAILLFSAAVFPVFKVETARFSLPFQSKIGCRRHLVVSRQERGHKMMLNCFSKEFIKIWDEDAVETEWWEYMNYLPECREYSLAVTVAPICSWEYSMKAWRTGGRVFCQILQRASTWVLIRWIPSRSPDQTFL